MRHYHTGLKFFTCCIIINSFAGNLQAQYVYDYKRTANLYFSKGNYYSAAQYFEKYLTIKAKKETKGHYEPYAVGSSSTDPPNKKESNDYEKTVYSLAESYRLYLDFGNAEKWYAVAAQFDSAMFPLAHYWYGVCLRSNKRYNDAEVQLSAFLSSYKKMDAYRDNAEKELKNVQFIEQQLNNKTYHPATISKMSSLINRGGATYAPLWYDDKTFIFTSSKPDSSMLESIRKKEDPYYNYLYQSTVTDTGFSRAERININTPKETQQGVAAYTPDKTKMFLTEWVKVDGKNLGAIYISTRKDNDWAQPVKVNANVNLEGYSSIQPFVTSDGKYLLFSSDRPGGMGKYDIWYATIDDAGNIGASINMGILINTKEDDQAPFFHAPTQTLVIASNGRVGMGGYDLYESKGDFSQWTEPKNLGFPINDVKDDIYFNSNGRRFLLSDAYLSSDRNSVCCLEIFSVKRKNKYITGKVFSCDTNEPLTGATVTIIDTVLNKILLTKTIDATGTYGIEMEEYQPLKVVAEKENYGIRSMQITANENTLTDTLYNAAICLKKDTVKPFPVNRPIVMQGIYYDFDKATLRPESYPVLDTLAMVMRMYPNMEMRLGSHTDGKGTVEYNLALSEARAKSCVDYLTGIGIESSRLSSVGHGKCCPVAANTLPNGKDDPGGRQLNRRTEFTVIHY